MSDQTSWFHCGRCGSMFRSPAGETDDRVCTACGRDPSLGIEPVAAASAFMSQAVAAPASHARSSGGHSQRTRGRSHLMIKLALVWLLVLAAIFAGARWLWKDDTKTQERLVSEEVTAAPASSDAIEVLNKGLAPSNLAFRRFLDATSPEERSQFVISPMLTAARMDRFYNMNPWLPLDSQQLSLTGRAVIAFSAGKAIETQWSSPDGHLLDAVFLEEGDEWRLDWDHFARASDYPWTMFLAGSGGDEGEFRLLARERLAEERKEEDTISIVLYAPRFGYAGESGSQSPEFLVPRASKNGRLLEAAFALARNGERVFGVDLPSIDPQELIRVRVKVRRGDPGSESRFELQDIIAPHWYATDEPGLEIPGD